MKEDSGSAFSYDWAPDKINWSKECECGNPKTNASDMCSECTFLDGKMEKTALVIDTLRGLDGLTCNELCLEIYGKATHGFTTGMYNTLSALIKSGRVRRYQVENDIEGKLAGNTTSWVYCLTTKRKK